MHATADVAMQHDWKGRCARQLSCMQTLLRAHALRRVHFDGDAIEFGEYTRPAAAWAAFNSAGCADPSVLSLPPERCDEGLPRETSAWTCAELRAHHAGPLGAEGGSGDAADAWADDGRLELFGRLPHGAPACAPRGGSCLLSGCCSTPGENCYTTRFGTAECRSGCRVDDNWQCERLHAPPPPPPLPAYPRADAGAGPLWHGNMSSGVCAESRSEATAAPRAGLGAACSGAKVQHDARLWCREQGARLCTADELARGAASGSGCGLDDRWSWSADYCGCADDHFLAVGANGVGANTMKLFNRQ